MQEEGYMVSSTWDLYSVAAVDWMISPGLLCCSEDWGWIQVVSLGIMQSWNTVYISFSVLKQKNRIRKSMYLSMPLAGWQVCWTMLQISLCVYYNFSVTKLCPTLRPHWLQHALLLCPTLSPGVCSNSCPLSQWSKKQLFINIKWKVP